MKRVLVACEVTGRVRDAFRALGHDAWSCDIQEADTPSKFHIIGDAAEVCTWGWDLMVAHPPCTYLCVSGNRWYSDTHERLLAIDLVRELMAAPIDQIAIENPVSVIGSMIRPADQTIQPWEFGHGETKATCLWLKNLPLLRPTDIVEGRESRIHRMPPGPLRSKLRSETYPGIAQAMAEQWGPSTLRQEELFA